MVGACRSILLFGKVSLLLLFGIQRSSATDEYDGQQSSYLRSSGTTTTTTINDKMNNRTLMVIDDENEQQQQQQQRHRQLGGSRSNYVVAPSSSVSKVWNIEGQQYAIVANNNGKFMRASNDGWRMTQSDTLDSDYARWEFVYRDIDKVSIKNVALDEYIYLEEDRVYVSPSISTSHAKFDILNLGTYSNEGYELSLIQSVSTGSYLVEKEGGIKNYVRNNDPSRLTHWAIIPLPFENGKSYFIEGKGHEIDFAILVSELPQFIH